MGTGSILAGKKWTSTPNTYLSVEKILQIGNRSLAFILTLLGEEGDGMGNVFILYAMPKMSAFLKAKY